jgi:hypothetical protein
MNRQQINREIKRLLDENTLLRDRLQDVVEAMSVDGPGGHCFRSENDIPMGLRPFQRRALASAILALGERSP